MTTTRRAGPAPSGPDALAALAALAAGLAAAPCAAAQNVAEVQVAPPSVTLRVGERTGLLATAFDRQGNVIPTVRFIWSSSNVTVARVDNNGTVTGVGGGVAIVEARYGPRRGQAAVQVTGPPAPQPPGGAPPPAGEQPGARPADPAADPLGGQPAGTGPAAALRIEPPTIFLLPSESRRASPRALKADGTPAAPIRVSWRSLPENVATVDQNGTVVALQVGQGTLQAVGPGGLTATAPILVQQSDLAVRQGSPVALAPGASDTLEVVVPAQRDRDVNPLALQWTSSDPGVARVSVTGVVTAVAPGRATLTVAGFLQSRTVEVVVHPPVEALAVRPPRGSGDVTLPLTSTQRFEATALGTGNAAIPEAPLRWTVADTAIASYDAASGLLTGRAVGSTRLTVQATPSLSVTWTVNVVAGTVRLAPERTGLALGERATVRAEYVDDAGAVLGPAVNLTWASDRPGVSTVGGDGTITAAGYGRARITATAPGGKTATTDVFVQAEIVFSSNRTGRFLLYGVERSNLTAARRVSEDSGSASEPAYSPDGSRLAFVSQRDGNAELYVMDADGRNPVRITTDPGADAHPVFAPDGRELLFTATRGRSQQIAAVGVDGSGLRVLTQEPGSNSQPTVSPDGRTIAFVSTREGNQDIWLMARDGTAPRAFTRTPQQQEHHPRFLRDGSLAYLVERRERGRTVTQVIKAELATGQTTLLTGTDLLITAFAVAPGGDLLALVVPLPGTERRRNPAYRVYIQPAGGAAVPLPAGQDEQLTTPTLQP